MRRGKIELAAISIVGAQNWGLLSNVQVNSTTQSLTTSVESFRRLDQ